VRGVLIGPGISDPVAMFAFRQNHAGEGGGFPVEVAAIHGGPFVEVLKHPRLGVLEGIRTVGIREMLFPDTSSNQFRALHLRWLQSRAVASSSSRRSVSSSARPMPKWNLMCGCGRRMLCTGVAPCASTDVRG
jgi:hypothetical protein